MYAAALAEYLKARQADAVTERLNEVYSRHSAKVDPLLNHAQSIALEKDSW